MNAYLHQVNADIDAHTDADTNIEEPTTTSHPSATLSATVMPAMSRRQILQRALAVSAVAATASTLPVWAVATPPLERSGHIPTSQGNTNTNANSRIATRLFASSNVGHDGVRNQLALQRLNAAGFAVSNPEVVARQFLRFAGTDRQRAADLQNIATGGVAAPELLMGVRGGYGAMRLLPMVDWASLGRVLKERGTIVTGFSDVTAIQCALLAQGDMSSMAAPMVYSEFGKPYPDRHSCQQFVQALTTPNLRIHTASSDLTSPNLPLVLTQPATAGQQIEGVIWGGNLSVLSALAGSAYLPNPDGGIVFIEEVGEQAYRIERLLYDLYLAGAFKRQQAIVFGAMTAAGSDSYDSRYDVAEVIQHLHQLTGLPIYSGFGFGHVGNKHSFVLGAMAKLSQPTDAGFDIELSGYPIIAADRIVADALWA